MGWVVNAMPQPFHPWERDVVPTAQEARWAWGWSVWMHKILSLLGFNSWNFQPMVSRCTYCAKLAHTEQM